MTNLLHVLLLFIVVAKDLLQLFFSRDSILELAKVHAGKPSKEGMRPIPLCSLVFYSYFEIDLEQG